MKSTLFWVGFNLCALSYGQTTWTEDFSDGRFDLNPRWSGDTARFIHNPNNALQLNDSVQRTSAIHTPSEIGVSADWAGFIRLDFNPSSSNFADVILMNNRFGNGYGLRIGGQSADRIEFYRLDAGDRKTLLQSSAGYLDTSIVKLNWEVTRNTQYIWEINIQLDSSGWQSIGNVIDSNHRRSETFELHAKYTKTRSTLFKWDDITVSGNIWIDSLPPRALDYQWLSRTELYIDFSEPLAVWPDTVSDSENRTWIIDTVIINRVYFSTLQSVSNHSFLFYFEGVEDRWGNKYTGNYPVSLSRPERYDVLITEIMTDPEPAVGLPPHEYVELFNRSGDSLQLSGWAIQVNSRTWSLDSALIPPHSFLILSDFEDSASYGTTLVLGANPGWLPNTAGEISLRDDWGEGIDYVQYNEAWFDPAWKSQGGWSLERDTNAPFCRQHRTWWASRSSFGGTPGRVNSHGSSNFDFVTLVERVGFEPGQIVLQTAFPVQITGARTKAGDSIAFHSIVSSADLRLWRLAPVKKLTGQPESWVLQISDCDGKNQSEIELTVAKPVLPETGQLRITEILPQPFSGHDEFIEMVNLGETAVDLRDLRWGSWSESVGAGNLVPISDSSALLMPGVICWASSNGSDIVRVYPQHRRENFLKTLHCPSLPEESSLCMATASGVVIDAIAWNRESHHLLLPETEGVSLSRHEWAAETSAWHSTPDADDRATPGIHRFQNRPGKVEIEIPDAVFSPNNDGLNDFLVIYFGSELSGWMADIEILTPSGERVVELDRQRLISEEDQVLWNGRTSKQKMAVPGQYLVWIRCWHADGRQKNWRHGCLLTWR